MYTKKGRENYLSWDEIFMMIAKIIAQKSKDPSTQTGAVVVGRDNMILGLGYNDWPSGVKEGTFSWSKNYGDSKKDILNTKYPYVVHAEINAVLNANRPIKDGKIYCLLFPCIECAKIIIQSGIRTLIYEDDRRDKDVNSFAASKKLFDAAGITYKKYILESKLLLNRN